MVFFQKSLGQIFFMIGGEVAQFFQPSLLIAQMLFSERIGVVLRVIHRQIARRFHIVPPKQVQAA